MATAAHPSQMGEADTPDRIRRPIIRKVERRRRQRRRGQAMWVAAGEGMADIAHKGRITTALLDVCLSERVKQLTDGEQYPVMSRPDAVPDLLVR